MPGKILVVDDNVEFSEFLKRVLSREGYSVFVAHDGEEAWKAVQNDRPDLIVLDLMMPKVDGFEVFRRLRADEKFKDVPVIACSALAPKTLPEVERKALAGVKAHLTKPFDMKEFLAQVKAIVEGRGNGHPKHIVV